ncbi:glycosyltransferase family 4 protein [Thermoanaerobacterium thermosaccharolyticum]|uniref:glycosyltransferase family 4 protein n=1 Tax=Thermoanaerobacterium thermosaccharolyticum TaxID=1517 RepID=UPI003DA9B206
MKVALIYLGRKGGGSIYSIEMAKSLSKKADIFAVISKQSENIIEWHKTGLNVLEVDTYTDIKSMVLSTMNIKKFLSLKRKILNFRPDVLYYPMIHTWTPIINMFIKHIPKIVTIHDPRPHKGEENIILEKISNMSIKQADRVVILSNIFKEIVINLGINPDKIDVIPHGEFSYYARKNSTNKKEFKNTILFFGRISKYKGIEVLLRAFKIIKTDIKDAKLMIVGSGDMTEYKELIDGLKDIEVINRWVRDEEVGSFFLKADFLVVPYIDASQSGVIPTAYSFSMPVVASRIGGIPEQVDDGKTGFLVEPGDENELAEKCVELLNNPDLIIEMGENAYKKALNEMSWEHVSNLLMESIKKIINERSTKV